MEKLVRKVQLMGGSTYIISLPKDWAKKAGISRGSLVTLLIEPDGSLRIVPSTKTDTEFNITVINISKDIGKGALIREIMSRYLAGYKVIRVRFEGDGLSQRRVVREIISKKLIGVEILQEDIEEITLQVLVNVEELPINTIINRMSNIALGMIGDVLQIMDTGKNIEAIPEITERDDLVDKLYLYGLRQLNATIRGYLKAQETGLKRLEEVLQYGVVLKSIERVGDHAEQIALNLQELYRIISNNFTVRGRVIDFGEFVKNSFNESVTAFVDRNKSLAHTLMDKIPGEVKGKEREISNVLSDLPATEAVPLRLIISSLRRIADYSMDILEATIDLTIE